jgi:cellulose synthase/poly-beta-1,6-N-acetylglucosamine synthase-like glycosyltransferase
MNEPRILEKGNPYVSVLVPAKNEARFIRACIDSMMTQDYSQEKYEVIVIDDSSSDSTPEIVQELQKQHDNLVFARNAGSGTAHARNTGLFMARGSVIVNFSAHAMAQSHYLTTVVSKLNISSSVVAGVGCRHEIPSDDSYWAKVFGLAMRSPLGAMGSSYVQMDREGVRDSIAFTAYRKQVFDEIGPFDSDLSESDDAEFNSRLKEAGYQLLYTPAVVVFHHQRSSFVGFTRKMFAFGIGRAKIIRRHPGSFRIHYSVPTAVVASFVMLVLASLITRNALLLLVPLVLYYAASLLASIAHTIKTCPKCLPLVPLAQFTMHIAYGIGFAIGFLVPLLRSSGKSGKKYALTKTKV